MWPAKKHLMIHLFCIIILSGCILSNEKPNREYLQDGEDFIGFVTQIEEVGNKGVIGILTIESHADKLVTEYSVTVTPDTTIMELIDKSYLESNIESINQKDWVKVWFSDPVSESHGAQMKADQILIFNPHE